MNPLERPLIGINGLLTNEREPKLELATRYANAILKAGGVPLALVPIGGPGDIERALERLDGLLLSGGDDFDTQRLGLGPTHAQAVPVPPEKQDFDVALARLALERGIPTLGICYGMQLLGLVGGGRIYQHLPEDRPGSLEHRKNAEHAVILEPRSKLAQVMREESVDVISRHHQALSDVVAPWRVCGRDPEGLIEAIEHETQRFAIGVQWHPELASEGSVQDRLFRAFVGAAAMHANRKLLTSSGARSASGRCG